MQTTVTDLVRLYDKTITFLEKRVDSGEITGTELSELRKLLDAGAVLSLVRAQSPEGKATGAVQADDLPFPIAEDVNLADFPELRRG